MKTVLFIFLTISLELLAQQHELSVGLGTSYYYGDLNSKNSSLGPLNIFSEATDWNTYRPAMTLSYRGYVNDYFSFGFGYTYAKLTGNDNYSKGNSTAEAGFYRKVRNLSFFTDVYSTTIDFRFEPWRTYERWNSSSWLRSPYIGLGLGIFQFNPKTTFRGREIELQPLGTEGQGRLGYGAKYNLVQPFIPMSFGIQIYDPNRIFSLGFDITYGFTFTDYIDDVSGSYADPLIFEDDIGSVSSSDIQELANRNIFGQLDPTYGYITKPGEIRGNKDNNDNYFIAQLRFSWFFSKRTGSYSNPMYF